MSEVNNLKEAEKVLWWYPQPNSLIDEGNLYFAAIEYQSAYQSLQKENESLKSRVVVLEEALNAAENLVGYETPLAMSPKAAARKRYERALEAMKEGLDEK